MLASNGHTPPAEKQGSHPPTALEDIKFSRYHPTSPPRGFGRLPEPSLTAAAIRFGATSAARALFGKGSNALALAVQGVVRQSVQALNQDLQRRRETVIPAAGPGGALPVGKPLGQAWGAIDEQQRDLEPAVGQRDAGPVYGLPTIVGLPEVVFPPLGRGPAPVPSAPAWPFNPQGRPGGLERPDWDWEEWDRENRVDPRTGEIHPRGGELDEPTEEQPMAIDWGAVLNAGIDAAQGQRPGGGTTYSPLPFAAPGTTQVPAQVTVDTRTGEVKPCRRRRRRRLLTPTDLSDLAALQAIVGKGDALKLAVAKAVRR